MSRAPWNNVLHPAASTAVLPLVTASAAAGHRRLHLMGKTVYEMEKQMVSLIIPAYNAGQYIQRAIESALAQTCADIEIICVNDGSEDDTLDIIQCLAGQETRIIVLSKANEGVSRARQWGVEHSRGDYIGFLDADDAIEPVMVERLLNNLVEYKADISHCGYDVTGLDGQIRRFYGTGKKEVYDRETGVVSLLEGRFEPTLCNKLYRRSLLERVYSSGRMDNSIRINEDLLMNYYLFAYANASVFEDVCLYHYLKRAGSASTGGNTMESAQDQIRVKELIRKDAYGKAYEKTARTAYLFTVIHIYNALIKGRKPAEDGERVLALLRENKSDFDLLCGKYWLLAQFADFAPRLYKSIYKLFDRLRG